MSDCKYKTFYQATLTDMVNLKSVINSMKEFQEEFLAGKAQISTQKDYDYSVFKLDILEFRLEKFNRNCHWASLEGVELSESES